MKITLLNTSVLTNYGMFDFQPISLLEARELVENAEINSAIGHPATAEFLSELLEIEVETNRVEFVQGIDETAIVFKLKTRIAIEKVLNRSEIEKIGYEFGILRRLK